MTQTFTIPGRLAGMNDYQRACRSHWSVGAKMKAEQQQIVEWAILAAYPTPFTRPVTVRILWVEKNSRRDSDNVFAASKWVLDALVSMGIIPDDSPEWVKGIAHERAVDKSNPRVVVTLTEWEG